MREKSINISVDWDWRAYLKVISEYQIIWDIQNQILIWGVRVHWSARTDDLLQVSSNILIKRYLLGLNHKVIRWGRIIFSIVLNLLSTARSIILRYLNILVRILRIEITVLSHCRAVKVIGIVEHTHLAHLDLSHVAFFSV